MGYSWDIWVASALVRDMAGYSHDTAQYITRLRRIEGQVRGIQKMVAEDQYCIDVLTQISAATRALEAVAIELLREHLSHCVVQAAQESGEAGQEKVQEAMAAIARLIKS